jgi:MerR family transcriptional regulator, thiopeptide resistance regulator
MSGLYKAREFASLAGVTVRTLHHYDRIGLLRPQRSSSGYRLYSLAHLERLEQITALKFLGIPLKEIKILLGSNPLTFSESLHWQLKGLLEKRDLITRAIRAIEVAEQLAASHQTIDATVLRQIIAAIEMQPEENFMRKYYTDEAWAKRVQIRKQTASEKREANRDAWRQLFSKVEAVLDLDPAEETVQLLAKEWVLLAEVSTGGDSGIKAGAIKAWKDHQNWPLPEQDGLLGRFGLDSGGNRDTSLQRVEKVGKFIGQAVGRKYYGALDGTPVASLNQSSGSQSSQRWVDLFQDVEAALAEDPAGEKAQALAGRWAELKRDAEVQAPRTTPQPNDFLEVLRSKWPPDASVAVINQVARLYRIEQVSSFLAKAVARGEEKRNSA